jgi:hypothetical protein
VEAADNVVVCSAPCSDQANRTRDAINLVARKTLRSNLVTAWFCWLAGGIILSAGVLEAIGGETAFALVPSSIGIVFIFAGVWYKGVSRRDS